MNLEQISQHWVHILERRKSRMSYSFVWYLLGLGAAIILFGFLDRVWAYYLEGLVAVSAAIVLFIVETCWRRITELKVFLSEYRRADRNEGMRVAETVQDSALGTEAGADLADREEQSMARGRFESVEIEVLR